MKTTNKIVIAEMFYRHDQAAIHRVATKCFPKNIWNARDWAKALSSFHNDPVTRGGLVAWHGSNIVGFLVYKITTTVEYVNDNSVLEIKRIGSIMPGVGTALINAVRNTDVFGELEIRAVFPERNQLAFNLFSRRNFQIQDIGNGDVLATWK